MSVRCSLTAWLQRELDLCAWQRPTAVLSNVNFVGFEGPGAKSEHSVYLESQLPLELPNRDAHSCLKTMDAQCSCILEFFRWCHPVILHDAAEMLPRFLAIPRDASAMPPRFSLMLPRFSAMPPRLPAMLPRCFRDTFRPEAQKLAKIPTNARAGAVWC